MQECFYTTKQSQIRLKIAIVCFYPLLFQKHSPDELDAEGKHVPNLSECDALMNFKSNPEIDFV